MPRARVREIAWFQAAVGELNNQGVVNYAELVPLRQPWKPSLKWAPWGPCMWRFFRAWCVCRAWGSMPLAVWGCGRVVEILAKCWLCGETLVGLRHLLQDCRSTAVHRSRLPPAAKGGVMQWALEETADVEELRTRVRFVGLCLADLAYGLVHWGSDGSGEFLRADGHGGGGDEPQGRAARRPPEAWEVRLGGDAPSVARRRGMLQRRKGTKNPSKYHPKCFVRELFTLLGFF